MAGTVKYAKLENRTARGQLRPALRKFLKKKHQGKDKAWTDTKIEEACDHHSYWQTIITGRAHLGYQRKQEAPSGRWILRRYNGKAYSIEELGRADDEKDKGADGVSILTFEQAKAKAISALDASAEGKPHGRLTVRRAVANYVDFLQAEGRAAKAAEQRAARHILPMLGDVEVAALTSDKIRKWLAALAASPAFVRTRKGERQSFKLAPGDNAEAVRRRRSTSNRVLTILKAALNHAYDEKHVTSNEAWGRRARPFLNVEVARIRYLTIAEARRLINACEPDFRKLVQAALETGARYGELTSLEVQDFNPDAGTVSIRKSKSGKPRHVVLTDQGAAFFRQVCAGRAGNAIMVLRADGKPWRASHQGRPMEAASAGAKLTPPITFHGLRHTWASLSVMAGVPLMVVAKNLGHANTSMVEKHYGHLAPSYIVDAIRAGAPRFGFKPDRKLVTL